MSSRKIRRPRKRNAGKKQSLLDSQKFRILFASVFLLAFVGVSLLLLVYLRQSYLPAEQQAYREKPRQETRQIQGFDQIAALVNDELLNGPLSQGWQKLPAEGELQRFKMFGDYPEQGRMLGLAEKIALTGAPASLDLLPRKGLVQLYWQDRLRLELRYRVPIEISSTRPRIAIIMDDMGRSLKVVEELLQLDLAVTPSILPESRHASDSAMLLQRAGREYMIHLPMQPKNYPKVNPGKNALLLGQTEMETRRLVRHYMALVPGAAGGNNHMGSQYTLERGAMKVVLEELKQEGQFFIDSKTIGGSVAYDEARNMGVATASRNIFLDNEESVDYIRQQIRRMVRLSEDKGEVIAICHPYSQTIEALRQETPWLKQQKIDFVSASQLTRVYR